MTLFFYIIRDYLKYVFGTILLTVFLFVLFDLIHKSSKDFAEYNPSAIMIFRFYLYQIPAQVVQALPIAALLSSVITMIFLSRTNEITAMRAAGMSAWQIGRGLAYGGLGLSVIALVAGELWLPRLAQRVHYIQEVEMRGIRDDQIASTVKWFRHGQSLLNFQEFEPISQVLSNVEIVELRSNFRPIRTLRARTAAYLPDQNIWRLKGINAVHFKRDGTLDRVDYTDSLKLALPIEPAKLKKERRKPNELSIFELSELVERGEQSGADTMPYRVDLQGKIAYPFAAFVVSLIGLKFGYKSERSTETARGVLVAFFIGISYWFVMSASRALGLQGALHPFLAAWMPNFIVSAIIGIDAWMGQKL
ncbi:MAG: LPS export ABC transporter permease LptG [Proteobacteria bacterium]|nr:LPS export ABC transporter permease LptG [Pseudomonadota bacterium]